MGKGENAGYQHFLLLPQCLQKNSFPDTSKSVIVWEWVNHTVKNECEHFRNYMDKAIYIINTLQSLHLTFSQNKPLFLCVRSTSL